MTAYICSKCGGQRTTVNESRPSVDDRYAVGYCDDCGPQKFETVIDAKGKKVWRLRNKPDGTKEPIPLERPVRDLVRADIWNSDLLTERRKAKEKDRLLRRVYDHPHNRGLIKPTQEEVDQAKEVMKGLFDA